MINLRKLAVLALGLMFLPMAAEAGSPIWVQEHFRWRNDDGSESIATWKANADTAITGVARGQNIRLRFAVANTATGFSGSLAARLEYATSTSGPWTPVSTASDGTFPFEMTTTSGYADQAATSAQLAGSGTFVAGKCVESPDNTSAGVSYGFSQYSNFEYCFRATAKAQGSATYYFRVSNAGYVLNAYSQYAALTMAAGEANEPPVIRSAL
ncbi:secreted protein, partial [sediment metagenome]